jgi:hypothetical protein
MDGQQLEVIVKMENKGVELVEHVEISIFIPDTGTVQYIDLALWASYMGTY